MKKAKIKNRYTGRRLLKNDGLESMTFENKVTTFCPLGGNITTKTIETRLVLGDYIPDLLDIEDYVKRLTNKSLTNEDLGYKWIKLMKQFKPLSINVKVISDGHFPLVEEFKEVK